MQFALCLNQSKTKNHQIKVYQFVDSSKVRNIDYLNSLINCNAIICFDLEDSIKIETNNYQQIRTSIFNDISELTCNHNNISELGIRINSTQSDYYQDDIFRISKLSNEQSHINIFLPKVSTSLEVSKTIKAIHSNKIQNFEIIPIMESKKGMSKLSGILSNNSQYISKIAFGHCDYNYDCNYFPFHHQDSKEYWDWAKILADTCGDEFTFLNSPYLNLKDDDSLFGILSRLKKLSNKTGQITLSLRQSKVCERFNQQNYLSTTLSKSVTEFNSIDEYANNLIDNFNQYKVGKKNFAIIPVIKKLISPQEYAKAIEIIRGIDEIKN